MLRFIIIKTVNACKDDLQSMNSVIYLLSTIVCSQNINKQIVNKTLTDYSFLIRFHYTKSKNYLIRRYRIRH